MIRGIGVDLVEVTRMAGLLDRFGERAETRLFTARERSRCRQCARVAQCYAGRFAAKEAVLKALGTGLASGITWTDVEVHSPRESAPPSVRLSGQARVRLDRVAGAGGIVHVSLSHEGEYAVAMAVIESPRDGA